MGRHSAGYIEAQQRVSGPMALSAASVGRVGALALALGIGAAVVSGAGTAHAEPSADRGASESAAQNSPDSSSGQRKAGTEKTHGQSPRKTTGDGQDDKDGPGSRLQSSTPTPPKRARSTGTTVSGASHKHPVAHRSAESGAKSPAAVRITTDRATPPVARPAAGSTGRSPAMPVVQAALQLLGRDIELFTDVSQNWSAAAAKSFRKTRVPSNAPSVPTPGDDVATAYGDIGKWMLQADGQISNWGGLPHDGKSLLESVNIVIVDPKSASATESAHRLNAAMFWSGFPAQPIHSTGFRATIDDVTYGQQPTGLLQGFSDNFFILPNNHGRIFGPDPVETSTGFVWSGAFSTEQFVIYDLLPRHGYVSSNIARNVLAMQLIASGRATYGGMVPLNNAYNTATTTTGDHDGYAVVVVLK